MSQIKLQPFYFIIHKAIIFLLMTFINVVSICNNANAQDATFSDPINNKTYFHPGVTSVLKGTEAGCSAQTNFVGVQPNPKAGFIYLNGSYKISKKFYASHGLSVLNDREGKSPQINTTSIKANMINLKWFYKKFEGINCDNFLDKPYFSMGFYLGMFNKSINTSDLIFSQQIVDWSATPISSSNIELYSSINKTDVGGNIEFRFPISELFFINKDNLSGSLCYSVHHLQSTNNRIKPTEASFVIQNQNIVLPRYHIFTFSLLSKENLNKELFLQYERQRPIQRIMTGVNVFLHPQLALTVAVSNYTFVNWTKNINSLICTANLFSNKREKGRDTSIYKFFFSYTSVLSSIGISPIVNKYGSFQVGIKFSKNYDCNFSTTDCPVM